MLSPLVLLVIVLMAFTIGREFAEPHYYLEPAPIENTE